MAKVKPEDTKVEESKTEETSKSTHTTPNSGASKLTSSPEDFPHAVTDTSKFRKSAKSSGQSAIEVINGRDMTLKGGEHDGETVRIGEFRDDLGAQLEVTLNGEPANLADLNPGDTVELGNGKKNRKNEFCYHSINATRKEEK